MFFYLMARLQSRTYTFYPMSECRFKDDNGAWVYVHEGQVKRTKKILHKLHRRMFDSSCGNTSDYLINGCVVKTNDSHTPTPSDGWCFRLYSETKKGLEEIAKKLGLPLENK